MDHPFGGYRSCRTERIVSGVILLEIGLVIAALAGFAILDLYVRGCDSI